MPWRSSCSARACVGERDSDTGRLTAELVEAGSRVGGCTNQITNWGLAEATQALDVRAEFARDAFSRPSRR
jgi:hypothetical protein